MHKRTRQELVQCLRIHVPALGFLDGVDNLKGLIGFGSDHHPCKRQRRLSPAAARHLPATLGSFQAQHLAW